MTIRKMSNELDDLSPMPFGNKYRGVIMQNVPVTYLHWFWNNVTPVGKDKDTILLVRDYIYRNLVALKEENDDLIWNRA